MKEITTKSFIYNIILWTIIMLGIVYMISLLYDVAMVSASKDSFNDNVEVYVNLESKSISCNMNYKTQSMSRQDYYDFCPYVIGIISYKLNLTIPKQEQVRR